MANTRVLVVDDNPTGLALVSYLLSHRGNYDVLSTPDPNRAIEIVRNSPCVAVVVSDVEMPSMRGPDLIKEIRQASPTIACVLMSASVTKEEQIPPDVPLLSKPIDAIELLSAVERVLSNSIQAAHKLQQTLQRTAKLCDEAAILKCELDETRREAATTIEESRSIQQQK